MSSLTSTHSRARGRYCTYATVSLATSEEMLTQSNVRYDKNRTLGLLQHPQCIGYSTWYQITSLYTINQSFAPNVGVTFSLV